MDTVKSLFTTAKADEKEVIFDANSQNASLLKPANTILTTSEGETPIIDDSALISSSGPAGTIADFEYLAPTSTNIDTYLVRKGDSLGKIADMFGVSINTILWANDIANAKSLKEGQTLVILPISGVKHKVKTGDTIQSITKLYGGDIDEVLRYNDIKISDKLVVGDVVIVPDGEIKMVNIAKTSTKSSNPVRGYKNLPNYDDYYIKPAVNVRKTQSLHGFNGIDFAPLTRTTGTEPILAAASGEVIISISSNGWNGGYGKLIVIKHPNGTQTVYGHCYTILVNQGDHVEQGQIIGVIGNTGKSTGPHLHFEVRGAHNPFQ
ncbi:MAG: peptidoglycan DD-metalloendopeptidase family protein [bacterium]